MSTPQAILFDLDDTLADRPAAIAAYSQVLARDFAGALSPDAHAAVLSALRNADDFGSRRQAERLCASSIWRSPIAADTLFDHWGSCFGAAAVPFADVPGVLKELRARGIGLGIITNGGAAMQRAKIAALGIGPLMSVVVISQEIGLAKPDPAIFDFAVTSLNCPAESAWFVGDNPDVDIAGAVGAGLRGFWRETSNFPPPAVPAERLRSLSELLHFL